MSPPTYWSLANHGSNFRYRCTYKHDFMVHDHGSITAADICHSLTECPKGGEDRFFFDHRCHICVPLTDMVVASGKMTIDHADRRVIDCKTRYDATLVTNYQQAAPAHKECHSAYFVPESATHSSLDSGNSYVLESYPLGVFYKHASEKSNEVFGLNH